MSCNSKVSGKTVIDNLNLAGVPTATAQSYVLDLTHYLCGGKKTCVNPSFINQGAITYTVIDVTKVGTNLYDATVAFNGQVSYLPFYSNQCNCCTVCPLTDFIYGQFNIGVSSATVPNVTISTTGSQVVVTPGAPASCKSDITNNLAIQTSFTVNVA